MDSGFVHDMMDMIFMFPSAEHLINVLKLFVANTFVS